MTAVGRTIRVIADHDGQGGAVPQDASVRVLNDRVFASIEQAQAAIDTWVVVYNTQRPHQGIGMHPPVDRFRLASQAQVLEARDDPSDGEPKAPTPAIVLEPGIGVGRWVSEEGTIRVGGFKYSAGRWLAGGLVEVIVADGLLHVAHKGTVVRTYAQRLRPGRQAAPRTGSKVRPPKEPTAGLVVTRIADSSGNVSFAGTSYRAGRMHAHKSVEVSRVGTTVQLAIGGKVIRVHAARHDPDKEHGAFATPKGRPRKPKAS